MTGSTGTPGWQMILLGGAALIVLWETWRGWRGGLVRSAIHLASLALSSFLGYYAAKIAAAPLGGFHDMSGLLTGVVVGSFVCVAVFVVMWIFSVVLFKRTDQQGSGIFRFLWGLGGAFFGFCLGMLIVWSGVSIIRGLGTFAAARMPSASATSATEHGAGTHVDAKSSIVGGLVTLKDSLEIGPLGKAVEATDPFTPEVYQLINQVGQVTGDQQVMLRFMQYPDIQHLLQNPRLAELVSDPSVMKSGQEGNILALMSNPALLSALEDPAFAAELKKVDLQAALKFALEKPTPTPSPSPTAKKK
jgi:uncharacterized membrane protein required for colicin V production